MDKNKIFEIIAWIILAIIVIGLLGFLGTSGVVILKIVGIEYQSVKHLIIFMVILFLLSIPIDLFVGALPKALYTVGKIKKENINLILYSLDFISNVVAINIIDYFMNNIKLSFVSSILLSSILTITIFYIDKSSSSTSQYNKT